MAYNKVLFPDKTVAIDLTNDTVDKNKLAIGATAHDRYGNIIVGNAIIGTRPDDLQESKEVAPTVEDQTVTPDYTYIGLKQVIVKAIPTINTTFTENKKYTPINGFFNEIIVNVQPKLQDKIVNPSLEPQIITSDEGNYGLGTVTITAVKLLQNKIVTPTTETQYVTLEDNDTENLGLKQVTVNPINIDSNNEFTENGSFPAEEGHFFNEVNINVEQGVFPNGTLEITENDTYDVTEYESVNVNVEQGVFPSGTLEITENGEYDVTDYSDAIVSIPEPTETKSITSNGIFNVKDYAEVDVNVETEQEISLENKTITENGIYNPSEGYIGFNEVTVAVPETEVKLQEKTASPSTSVQSIVADSGFDGLSEVTVTAMNLQEKTVVANGEVTPDENFDGLSKVTVNVPNREITLQEKSVTPNSNTQTITADANFDGLSKVTVNPVPIDSNNTFKSNGTFSSTGNSYFNEVKVDVQPPLQPNKTAVANGVVTADAGYYGLQQVTVSIPDTELYDNLTVEPKLETQVINASDYDAEGFTKVTVNGVQGYLRDATIHPSTIEVTYNAVDELGYLGYNDVTVAPVTAAIDSNIKPENIRRDVTILNVTGSYEPPITTGDLLAITLQPKYALVGYNYLNSNGNIVAGEMPIYNGSYEEIE